jgi:hypothetical protein
MITDFYEYGWGQSFHFAPRNKNESFDVRAARRWRSQLHSTAAPLARAGPLTCAPRRTRCAGLHQAL